MFLSALKRKFSKFFQHKKSYSRKTKIGTIFDNFLGNSPTSNCVRSRDVPIPKVLLVPNAMPILVEMPILADADSDAD